MHRGHLAVARAALRGLRLDRLLIVPSKRSPLKSRQPTAVCHRLAMLKLAFRGMPEVEVSTVELRRPAPSYTVDTLRTLKRRWPKAELFLVLGADAFRDLRRWRRPGEIRRLATLAVFPRPGTPPPEDVWCLAMKPVAASASAIRKGGRAGLPVPVARYIKAKKLYRIPSA